jgi:pimeloyl-ACP methyl ester carboxylesterase
MKLVYRSDRVKVADIHLHSISYSTQKPTLLLLHGLGSNCFCFQGLLDAGLGDTYHVACLDLRGHGQSDKPMYGYTITSMAADIMAWLDFFQIEKITLGGHSFGGLLSMYLAYTYPHRVEAVALFDASPQVNARVVEMLSLSMNRFNRRYPNLENYIHSIRQEPYMEFWEENMKPMFVVDMEELPEHSWQCVVPFTVLLQLSSAVGLEPWSRYFESVKQPVLFFNGTNPYVLGEVFIPEQIGKQQVRSMHQGQHIPVPGNHHTLLFGSGAKHIVHHMMNSMKA